MELIQYIYELLTYSVHLTNGYSVTHCEPITTAAILAAASLLGSGISSIFNKKSVDRTNEQNLQIARENNAASEKLMNMKFEADRKMWDAQNSYNTPLAQSQRMLQAGMNPYLSDISTGTASSAPELDTYTPQSATMQAYQIDPNMVSNAVNVFSNTLLNQEQAKTQRIENQYRGLFLQAGIEKLKSETKNVGLKNALQGMENQYFQNSFSDRLSQAHYEAKMAELRSQQADTELMILKNNLKVLDATTKTRIDTYTQKLANDILAGKKTEAEIMKAIADYRISNVSAEVAEDTKNIMKKMVIANYNKVLSSIAVDQSNVQVAKAQYDNLYSQMGLNQAKQRYTDTQTDNYDIFNGRTGLDAIQHLADLEFFKNHSLTPFGGKPVLNPRNSNVKDYIYLTGGQYLLKSFGPGINGALKGAFTGK